MGWRVMELNSVEPSEPLGLYVHVPFCASTCDFCAFYQTKPSAEGVENYLKTVEKELSLVSRSRRVSSVFWGGGTPGLLSPSDLRRLGATVRGWTGDAPSEWTVEMAPASVTDARLRALKEIGVTRISMGAQSFQPELLDALGRQHSLEQVMRAYDRIRAVGFQSVNIDLMFALPGQDEAAWMADLTAAVALDPDHISTYCLTFEEDTKLWVKLSEGKVKLDPEHEARLYERTWERLAVEGYAQYEVANFAKPGHKCFHNYNTWQMHEWVGIGPAAASQHDGWRAANPSDLDRWSAEVDSGERMSEDRVELSPELLAEDALIFGLRLNEGVNLDELAKRWPEAPWAVVHRVANDLVHDGLARKNGAQLKLTVPGRLLADAVGASVMEAMSE